MDLALIWHAGWDERTILHDFDWRCYYITAGTQKRYQRKWKRFAFFVSWNFLMLLVLTTRQIRFNLAKEKRSFLLRTSAFRFRHFVYFLQERKGVSRAILRVDKVIILRGKFCRTWEGRTSYSYSKDITTEINKVIYLHV